MAVTTVRMFGNFSYSLISKKTLGYFPNTTCDLLKQELSEFAIKLLLSIPQSNRTTWDWSIIADFSKIKLVCTRWYNKPGYKLVLYYNFIWTKFSINILSPWETNNQQISN